VSVYPSLDAAVAARLPAVADKRTEGTPGRGSAQQAHLRVPEGVIAGLSRVGLSLRAALGLPADGARKHIEEALDDLDDVIREIGGPVTAARDLPAPPRAPRQ
jgi:hypothetical protein